MAVTIKTEEEVNTLREGGKRLAFILKTIAERVAPGVTALDLENWAREMIEEGGDQAAFLGYTPDGANRPYPAALCVSVNEEVVHGIPNESPKVLKDGDIVTLDMGLVHGGLYTDSAITVPVGKIDATAKKLLKATRESLDAGIQAARGGGHIGDIGAAVDKVAKKYGFSHAKGLSGHGVGYKVHEDPYVPNEGKEGAGELLKSGMVIAIEPMLCEGAGKVALCKDGYTYKTADGKRSAHFEHTVAITEGAPIIITAL